MSDTPASGQPVCKMMDKSGHGNHGMQAISAKRPIYTEDSGLAWPKPTGPRNQPTNGDT